MTEPTLLGLLFGLLFIAAFGTAVAFGEPRRRRVALEPSNALALPSKHHKPLLEKNEAKDELDALRDWIRKYEPDAEIQVAHKKPQGNWEKLPFSWKDKEIWIRKALKRAA